MLPAACSTSHLSIGSPPASSMKLMPSSSASLNMRSHSSSVSCFSGSQSTVASLALEGVEILSRDFADAVADAGPDWFVYFDPPYRPLSSTSSFCDYTQGGFDDDEQRRLARLCRSLDAKGARWLLSNSDPKGTNPDDTFFDELYAGFEIRGVRASRMLNANPEKRGKLGELLISNYQTGDAT